MKISRKTILHAVISLIIVGTLIFGLAAPAFAIDDVIGTKRYSITNTYAGVDWDNWQQYKGNLHTHSQVSDGDEEFKDMIEAYYTAGYDVLAMTDHGMVNYGWDVEPQKHLILNGWHSSKYLTTARKNEIYNGVGRNGRGMTEVPLGIELNGASAKKVHINGWYADYGNKVVAMDSTWPTEAVRGYHNAGGITHINHIGEWSGGDDDKSKYDINGQIATDLTTLYMTYSSCLGMELVNKSDGRTGNDRYLYDNLLQKLAPQGRNIFGFCEDDAHSYGDMQKGWQMILMPSNTQANVRTALTAGRFFAVAKNCKSVLGNGFTAVGEAPRVTRVSVDSRRSQITVATQNSTRVEWVANGTVIHEGETIDLNAYESDIGSYVRAQVVGPGGVLFVQPFLLTSQTYSPIQVDFTCNAANSAILVYDSQNNLLSRNISGKYLLGAGTYSYSVTAPGYIPITKEPFTVTTADLVDAVDKIIPISMLTTTLSVSFNITPGDATVTVYDSGGGMVFPREGNVYSLPQGVYSYSVNAANHVPIENAALVVSMQDLLAGTPKLIEVNMSPLTVGVSIYSNAPSYSIKVYNSEGIEIETATSVYNLAKGDYSYTVQADGYFTSANVPFSITQQDIINGQAKAFTEILEKLPTIFAVDAGVTKIDKTNYYIHGLEEGTEDIASLLEIEGNGTLRITPTALGYGTGTKIELLGRGEVIETYYIVYFGDINGDCYADGTDAILAHLYLRDYITALNAPNVYALDANNSKSFNADDVLLMESAGVYLSQIDQISKR